MIRLLSARSCDPRPSPRFGRVGRGLSRDKYSLITRCPLSPSFLPPRTVLSFCFSSCTERNPRASFLGLVADERKPPSGLQRKRFRSLVLVFFPLFVSPLDIFKGSVVPFRFPRSNFYAVLFLPSFSRARSRLFIAALGDLLAHLSASSDFFDAVSFASLEISPLFSFFSLFVPLISATFVRVVSSRRFKIRFQLFSKFFPLPSAR